MLGMPESMWFLHFQSSSGGGSDEVRGDAVDNLVNDAVGMDNSCNGNSSTFKWWSETKMVAAPLSTTTDLDRKKEDDEDEVAEESSSTTTTDN